MGKYFHIQCTDDPTIIQIGFAEPAQNDLIVPDAIAALDALDLPGGHLIRFNGPASLPVAMALAHAVAHRYEVVACFDPKLACYIVAISHHPTIQPGDRLVSSSDVPPKGI